MRSRRPGFYFAHGLVAVLVVLVSALLPLYHDGSAAGVGGAQTHIVVLAKQYDYQPNRIVVNQGDVIHIRLGSYDVVHGFYLEGYDIEAEVYPGKIPFKFRHPSEKGKFSLVEEIVFTADRAGKFRYRCSVTCGPLHPFMLGELIVRPNYPYHIGMGATFGVLLAAFYLMFVMAKTAEGQKQNPSRPYKRIDLLAVFPWLKWLVKRRWLQFTLMVPGVFFLLLFIIAGFWGSPIGNRNISVTFVWIFWWFLLISILLPFGARLWCLLCPIPFFGEWLQRRKLLGPDKKQPFRPPRKLHGLNRKWPAALSNIWIQNILFLAMCTFSSMLITRPIMTALALAGLTLAAFLVHAIYQRRTFCLYICPVSGFLGLYSMASMVEIRSKYPGFCSKCSAKVGILGSVGTWACPWFQRPSRLVRNNNCGFCLECIKGCPHDKITIYARPFCSDNRIVRMDEAWKSFIMITLAFYYSIVLMGPWGWLKEWANVSEMGNWGGFFAGSLLLWCTALVFLPALWAAASWLARKLSGTNDVSSKTLFLRYSYLLVPIGLISWIVFSLPLILINGSYILTTLSDPMGWGWNLFGTANIHWTPLIPEYVSWIQAPLLILGLGFTLKTGYRISRSLYPTALQGIRSSLPFSVLCFAITAVLLTLYMG